MASRVFFLLSLTSKFLKREPDPDAPNVAPAQQGDIEAFECLYRAHVGRINSLAGWMLGSRDTDDVLQDIFIRAWNKLGTFRGESAFGTWLHQLAVNVILQHRERVRVRQDRYVADERAVAAAPAREEDLSGLPPAYVSVMEFDPLRDEGILYALGMLQAGVSVELHAFPGTFHGSSLLPGADASRRNGAEVMAVLKRKV